MNTLVLKTIFNQPISDNELTNHLNEICHKEHSNCNEDCPVFYIVQHEGVSIKQTPKGKRLGCDCFEDGRAMLEFIRKNGK